MKSITKIMIAFLTITMIITPAMGYEIYEQPDDQPEIFDEPSYNEWIHHRTLSSNPYNPTALDDLRAGYNSPDPQKYF